MTYRELAHHVLRQNGRMEVTNPGGRGPLQLAVVKNGQTLALQAGLTLDEAAARCAVQLRGDERRPAA